MMLLIASTSAGPAASESGSTGSEPIFTEYQVASINDSERARAALAAIADARRSYDGRWQIRSKECRQRITVNRCQSELKAERQGFESKSTEIEIHARQVIRNTTITERNSAEAKSGDRATAGATSSGALDSAAQRALRLQQREDRLAGHEAELARKKQLGVAEAKKRQERITAIEQRRQAQQRKIDEARKRATIKRSEATAKDSKALKEAEVLKDR